MNIPHPMHRDTLLVADRDAAFRAVLRASFQAADYRVLTAETLAATLEILSAVRVDLVLTEAFHAHSDPDPWSSLVKIAGEARGAPVIICSGRTAQSFTDYTARGFAGLISKPFDLADLNTFVREAVVGARRPTNRQHAARRG